MKLVEYKTHTFFNGDKVYYFTSDGDEYLSPVRDEENPLETLYSNVLGEFSPDEQTFVRPIVRKGEYIITMEQLNELFQLYSLYRYREVKNMILSIVEKEYMED